MNAQPTFANGGGWQRRLIQGLLLLAGLSLAAGPPYLTDDPEPVALHHWEVYLFSAGQSMAGLRSGLGPAVEANYGPFQDAQLQFQIPMAFTDQGQSPGSKTRRGLGDVEAGFKYRFLHETEDLPQVAVYPQIFAPTGSEREELGDGHWKALLPLWLQKDFGPWTTHGGAGWWRNPGAGNRDFLQYGWLIQRELAEGWSLGAEVFHQNSAGSGQLAFSTWNLGFEAALVHHLQLVGSGGRVFQGLKGSQYYLGLRGNF
ncbi:MAG TPA: transporter [Geothrix sp.]